MMIMKPDQIDPLSERTTTDVLPPPYSFSTNVAPEKRPPTSLFGVAVSTPSSGSTFPPVSTSSSGVTSFCSPPPAYLEQRQLQADTSREEEEGNKIHFLFQQEPLFLHPLRISPSIFKLDLWSLRAYLNYFATLNVFK